MASIVFDLDGTLIDSAPDIRNIANRVLSQTGYAPLSMAETHAFIGNGAGIFVQKMCQARSVPASEQALNLKTFLDLYEGAVDLTKPYPGVIDALIRLREKGHRLGICTNKPMAPSRAILTHLDLTDQFDIIICGDSLTVRKPNPEPLQEAIGQLEGGFAIYVGDSEVDAETARCANVPFVLFTRGYRKISADQLHHDATFDDFVNLPDIIEMVIV